jgi:hypothetical protein
MMKTGNWFLAALLGVAAGGCIMEVGEPGVDGVYEDEVAVSTAALSSVRTRGEVSADRFVGFIPNAATFYEAAGEHCAPSAELIFASHLAAFNPFSFDTCMYANRIASDGLQGIFVADFGNDDIHRVDWLALTKLADTNGDARGIFADATHVYWADGSGLRKVSHAGGAVTALTDDPSLTLRALRGTTLYYSKALLNNAHQLRRLQTTGGNSAAIITYTSATGFKDFAVDGSAMYWVDNTQATNRMRRLSHAAGAAMTTVISHAQDTYALPTPTPNGMHFVQWTYSGIGTIKIRRLLNGVITDQYDTLVDIVGMSVDRDRLYWVEEWPSYFRIKNGDL